MITPVERFWNEHTVLDTQHESAEGSFAHLDWRSEQYPLFPELMDLWDGHAGETVLDYGCGPANDLIGFADRSQAKRIIGMDCSALALWQAEQRLKLHRFPEGKVTLTKVSDAKPVVPLPDGSVDFINCVGVLHHVTYPNALLREFWRVLRDGGSARIMVHNYDSVWAHFYVAQCLRLQSDILTKTDFRSALGMSTDGADCPISRFYSGPEFVQRCAMAGLTAEFLGGYYNVEVDLQPRSIDDRLEPEHRAFLEALTDGPAGPLYNGLPAGVGGVYAVMK